MQDLVSILMEKRLKAVRLGIFLVLMLIVSAVLALSIGKAQIGIQDILTIIMHPLSSSDGNSMLGLSEAWVYIIRDIRLPRILIAILVGGGLAVSGAVFQALLGNPLADSYTMGVSAGAAFAAVLAIYFNLMLPQPILPVTICAFAGALLTLGLVFAIARVKGYLSAFTMIIAGIIVNAIFSAGVSFIKSISGENVVVIVSWLMGSLSARNWDHVLLTGMVIVAGVFLCIRQAEDLNIMCLGDEQAVSLGVNVVRVRRILLIAASLITAVCVSVSGIIGFVGLVVPHILRLILGSNQRFLLPLSALLGGELLLLADTFTRVALNVELPVGIITTLVGGPFFIYIFVKSKQEMQ